MVYLEDTLPAVKIMSKNRPSSGNTTSNVPRRKKGSSSADEQTALVKQLCKTYTHSVSKLVYAFAALQEQTADDSHDTVSAALAKSSRADAIEAISTALAGGVAKVIRCEDLSLRTGVLRDLRARFVPPEPSAGVDCGVQTWSERASPRPKRKPKKVAEDPPAADAAAKAAAAVVAPAPAAVGVAAAAAGFARAAARPASAVAMSTAAADGDDASSRPASALPKVSAFHQRQMMWQSKKLIKIAEKKVDKENKEREVTLPPMRKKMLGQYAHVESVLKRERVKEEDTRVNAAERRADEEAEARMAAERVAKEAVKEKQRIQEVCDLAETLRMTAERARVGGALAHARGRGAPRSSGAQFGALFGRAIVRTSLTPTARPPQVRERARGEDAPGAAPLGGARDPRRLRRPKAREVADDADEEGAARHRLRGLRRPRLAGVSREGHRRVLEGRVAADGGGRRRRRRRRCSASSSTTT